MCSGTYDKGTWPIHSLLSMGKPHFRHLLSTTVIDIILCFEYNITTIQFSIRFRSFAELEPHFQKT